MNKTMKATLSAGAVIGLAGAANADFSGQTILGPLGPGSSVMGDTNFSTNDNNGGASGVPGGSWGGGDDVYQLNWPGGSISTSAAKSPSCRAATSKKWAWWPPS